MIDGLTALINAQGWLAPMWYVAGFLLTALVPVIPTPLVAAIGGTAFGVGPAIFYGLIGMGLGAALALTIARNLGRPVLRRLVPEATWEQWETFFGVRSYGLWFVIFVLLNMDIVVMASGLSSLSWRGLWATAMAARIPWLIGAAWLGDVLLVNDAALVAVLIVMIPVLWAVNKIRPTIQRWLARMAERSVAADAERRAFAAHDGAPFDAAVDAAVDVRDGTMADTTEGVAPDVPRAAPQPSSEAPSVASSATRSRRPRSSR